MFDIYGSFCRFYICDCWQVVDGYGVVLLL